MAHAFNKTTFNASADAIWQVLSDFGAACQFLFMVVNCTVEGAGVGARRTLTSADGSTIVERLETMDERTRRLSYVLLSDTPFRDCLTTITVRSLGTGQAEMEWSVTFEADGIPASEAVEMMAGAIKLNSEALQRYTEGRAP